MDSNLQLIASILVYWTLMLVLAHALSKKVKNLNVTPLMIIYRKPASFSLFEKLEGSKVFSGALWVGVGLTFLSMIAFYILVGQIALFRMTGEAEGVGLVPVIPGITIKGVAILYILVNLGLAVVVHELSHAAASKALRVPVKSTGLILAVVLPAAFVEPDEEAFRRSKLRDRVRILSAGPASNFVLGMFMLLLFTAAFQASPGVEIMDVEPGSPAAEAGLAPGFIITRVNGVDVRSIGDLQSVLAPLADKDASIVVEGYWKETGERDSFTVFKPSDRRLIGIIIRQASPFPAVPDPVFFTLTTLLNYGYIINLSLAVINAAPLFITDGGRILGDLLTSRLGDIRGRTLSFFFQVLTLLILLSSITFRPIG